MIIADNNSLKITVFCRMLQKFKSELVPPPSSDRGYKRGNPNLNFISNKVSITYDSVQGIKRLRREIVERMQVIMKLAKERKTFGMHKYVDEIYQRVNYLSIYGNGILLRHYVFLTWSF